MATAINSRCPNCDAEPGTLTIETGAGLQVKPLGTFSLSGAQMKFSAMSRPVLRCSACGLSREGTWDEDGRHASFGKTEG